MTHRFDSGRWTRTFGTEDATIRLLCFHNAGGGTVAFRNLAQHLPPSICVDAVVLPGRESRYSEAPYDRMEPLVEGLIEALGPSLDCPYALLGHSMGAQVAYRLARRLTSAGYRPPTRLYVAASPGPSERAKMRNWNGSSDALVAYLRHMGGTPPDVLNNQELLSVILPTLRADLAVIATSTYTDCAPMQIPIRAFAGADDPSAPAVLMASWQRETALDFELTTFPGDHFFPTTATAALADVLSADLTLERAS